MCNNTSPRLLLVYMAGRSRDGGQRWALIPTSIRNNIVGFSGAGAGAGDGAGQSRLVSLPPARPLGSRSRSMLLDMIIDSCNGH